VKYKALRVTIEKTTIAAPSSAACGMSIAGGVHVREHVLHRERTTTMEDLLTRIWENLVGRAHGPMMFRTVLQPAIAIFFAVRAGLHDAPTDRAPYFWGLLYDPRSRREMLRDGWHDVGKVFVLAMALDIVYQLIVSRWVYPGEVIIVAILLALVPYLLLRGLVTRIARTLRRTGPRDTTETQP
jgi:hypothetical protein